MSCSESNEKLPKGSLKRVMCSHFDKIVLAVEWKMGWRRTEKKWDSSLGFLLLVLKHCSKGLGNSLKQKSKVRSVIKERVTINLFMSCYTHEDLLKYNGNTVQKRWKIQNNYTNQISLYTKSQQTFSVKGQIIFPALRV